MLNLRRRFDIKDEEFSLYFLAAYFDDKINDFIIGVEGHSHQYMKYIEIAKKQGYNKEQCGIIGRNKLFESLKRLFKDIDSLLRQENIKNTIEQINVSIHKSTDTLICNGLISENDITTKNRITKLFKICFIRSMVTHFYLLQKENFIRKIATFTRENNSLDEMGVKLFSGRRFLRCQYSFTRCNNATFVIARPQNVAVAISVLRTIEIASLRSQ